MTTMERIREVLEKSEFYPDKGQCCTSCEEEKHMGYGDDIEACCCRHNTNEEALAQIKTILVESLPKEKMIKKPYDDFDEQCYTAEGWNACRDEMLEKLK